MICPNTYFYDGARLRNKDTAWKNFYVKQSKRESEQ
jgi:hypothetical protein